MLRKSNCNGVTPATSLLQLQSHLHTTLLFLDGEVMYVYVYVYVTFKLYNAASATQDVADDNVDVKLKIAT